MNNKLITTLLISLIMLTSSFARAGLILEAGNVVGVDNVTINNNTYRFDFFASPFSPLEALYSEQFAIDAATGIAAMFVGTLFENAPASIDGTGADPVAECSFSGNCIISLAYAYDPSTVTVTSAYAFISETSALSVGSNFTVNNNRYSNVIFARATAVPEPSTLAILGLGLMGLAARRFKKQA